MKVLDCILGKFDQQLNFLAFRDKSRSSRRVKGFRIWALGQTRHEKSRSVRRVEGFGVCFWVRRSTKSRDASGKMEVLDCIGMCVFLGQRRHEKSRKVRRVEGFGVYFWVKRST